MIFFYITVMIHICFFLKHQFSCKYFTIFDFFCHFRNVMSICKHVGRNFSHERASSCESKLFLCCKFICTHILRNMIINNLIDKLEPDMMKCRFPAVLKKWPQIFPSDMPKFSKKFFLQKTFKNFIYSSLASINDWDGVPAQIVILKIHLHQVWEKFGQHFFRPTWKTSMSDGILKCYKLLSVQLKYLRHYHHTVYILLCKYFQKVKCMMRDLRFTNSEKELYA